MHALILLAALFADPETLLLRAENELLKAKIAAMEAAALANDSPAVPESPTTPARFDILPGGKSADIPPPSSPAAASQAVPAGTEQPTLRQRIAAYRDSGGQRWYEERGGQLTGTSKAHLNLEHGWAAIDVHGLTQDELDLLHGASHTGRITKAQDVASAAPTRREPASEPGKSGIDVEILPDGRGRWLHPTLGWRWSQAPMQVGVKYRDLEYRADGKMYQVKSQIKPVIPQPSGYWTYQQQCVGGQCQMVPVWVPR